MAREYLNETGLASLWAKIVNKINAMGDLCVKKSGDIVNGTLTALNLSISGGELRLKPNTSSSNDSGDIVFYYGNGQEKARLYVNDNPTTVSDSRLNFRTYKSDGTALTSQKIPLASDIPDISTKVSKSGDTMTGSLTTNGSFFIKSTTIDGSKANNNVSSIQYPCFCMNDASDRILVRNEGVINPNGNIGTYWYVRNYNTSGGQVAQKGISMTLNKSGSLTYSIADAANFRSAIGVYAPTYSSASGTYKTAAWADGTNTCTWKAPAAGLYIVWMRFDLSDASAANRGAYVQLQMRGTATRLFNNTLYYDAEAASPRVVRTMCQPVSATAANQTIVPYIHTPTANVTYNVSVIAIRLT